MNEKRQVVYTVEEVRRYTIRRDRMAVEKQGDVCRISIRRLDGVKFGTVWGRLVLSMRLQKGSICTVYGIASDREALTAQEESNRWEKGCRLGINAQNLLLDTLCGRYLWIGIELVRGDAYTIRDLLVETYNGEFLEMFPKVYQESGAFFQRYLSIFSGMYTDLDQKIEHAPKLLDLDHAPRKLLNVYLEWMGMSGKMTALPEQIKRKLLKELYQLNRRKGTKQAFLKITEIVLGEEAVVFERGAQEIVVMTNQRRRQKKAEILQMLLEEYKPVRSKIQLVFGGEPLKLDGMARLGMETALMDYPEARLDGEAVLEKCMLAEGGVEDGGIYRNCVCQ